MATTAEPQAPPQTPPAQEHQQQQPPPDPSKPPNPRRKMIVIAVTGVAVIIAAIWGVKTYLYSRAHESTDDAELAANNVPLLSRVSGFVEQLRFDENQHVNQGDTIVAIEASTYRHDLTQAQADLAMAEAGVGGHRLVGQAVAEVMAAQGQNAATNAQVVAAEAEVAKTTADLARYEPLAERHIVSQQQLDAARAAAEQAQADLIAAERQAAASTASVSGAEAGVRTAQARLVNAQAAVANAALQLSYTTIMAPLSGTLGERQVQPGQYVQAGQTLFMIVPDTGIYIEANYKETQLNKMRVGQPVDFEVDAYPGCHAKAVVQSFSPASGAVFSLLPPENATGNYTKIVQRLPVRLRVTRDCGPDRPLRPGMSVEPHVIVRQ
jgi:membrane fusion protein (multidrug efflux system)